MLKSNGSRAREGPWSAAFPLSSSSLMECKGCSPLNWTGHSTPGATEDGLLGKSQLNKSVNPNREETFQITQIKDRVVEFCVPFLAVGVGHTEGTLSWSYLCTQGLPTYIQHMWLGLRVPVKKAIEGHECTGIHTVTETYFTIIPPSLQCQASAQSKKTEKGPASERRRSDFHSTLDHWSGV